MQERQLDGITDRLDLAAEATDHRVINIRYLFQDQLFDIQFRNPLVREVHPTIDQQRIPRSQVLITKPVREPDDAFLIAMPDHQCPVAALQHLLQQHDFADLIELQDLYDIHRLVDHHLLAG